MRVINCLGQDFDAACTLLLEKIEMACSPDLLIGIESGGGDILRRMNQLRTCSQESAFVRAAREGSKIKKRSGLKNLLKLFPRKFNDMLRIGEHVYREARFSRAQILTERNVEISDGERIRISKASFICLIDDAVDTGSSAVAVRKAIADINPNARIIVASIVQTFKKPLLAPDVVLYKDVLVRFPWSEDA